MLVIRSARHRHTVVAMLATTGGGQMAFLMSSRSARRGAGNHADALASWRAASRLVAQRWNEFATAGAADRSGAFAAYVAALDLEEAAADELAAADQLAWLSRSEAA
jgi:hypothetical protein